jgi:hypothetical protein
VTVSKAAFIWGIRQQESGGNYQDKNAGSGALGGYQVMPSNLAGWTKSALGYTVSAATFLATPADQDAVADKILGGYFDKYGPEGAASAWYSGDPNKAGDTASQNGGPSIADYVDEVMAHARAAPAGVTLPLSGQQSVTGILEGDDSGSGGLLGIPSDIVHFFTQATDDLTATGKFFWAFTQPATWVRIGAGYVGTLCLIAGIVCLGIAAMEGSSS